MNSAQKELDLARSRVKKNMKIMKISDAQIAKYCAHPLQDIKGWLKGKNNIPYIVLWRIYDLMEVS